jgi:hypothetical protein
MIMSAPNPPCRLFVILAREAPVGVIFRRGPSKWTQIIKWNTWDDSFEPGAWFHGNLYPERADLSPDGTKLIYFAAQYGARDPDDSFPGSWTAISKVPWLTALAVWPNTGTYFGGGLFETNTVVWVNQCFHCFAERPRHKPEGLAFSYAHTFWDHELQLLFRLEREGWRVVQRYDVEPISFLTVMEHCGQEVLEAFNPTCERLTSTTAAHEKTSADGDVTLLMRSHFHASYKGGQDRTFELRDNRRKPTVPLSGVPWADFDQANRLVYARSGKIMSAQLLASGELQTREIADFNASRPTRTKSPNWARHW